MNVYRSKWTMAAALVGGCLAWAPAADAGVYIQAIDGSLPAGATMDNLDWLTPGPTNGTPNTAAGGTGASGLNVSFSFDGGAAKGSLGGIYAAPDITATNGAGFGLTSGAPDDTVFATGGGTTGSSVTLLLPGSHNVFGLLWGSVDTFNVLTFKKANGDTIGTIDGSDLIAKGAAEHGSYYVTFVSDEPIGRVIATSGQYAFEFDNIGFGNVAAAPEPLTLSLFGAGLAGLGFVRRRKA